MADRPQPKSLGETLTHLIREEFGHRVFIDGEDRSYKITGWAGGEGIIQLQATYFDGSRRMIGANSHKDRVATTAEFRRYRESLHTANTVKS